MSKSYTVTLNDNVVSKLQEIIGGGNSLVSFTEFNTNVPNGSVINVDNLATLIQTKTGDVYSELTNVIIPGIINFESGQGATIFGDIIISSSAESFSSFISDEKTQIEGESKQYNYNDARIYVSDQGGCRSLFELNSYVLLVLNVSYYDGCVDQTYSYSLTLSDILTFIDTE